MPATSLQDLFVEELRDVYDGEKRLVRALPRMARAATADVLQTAFTTHARETVRQVSRLERVFRTIGQTPRGKKCDGILGIVEEGNRAIEELEGPLLDAALIAGAQKVEHYEISAYGTLAYFADLLGLDKAKDLLGTTLDEEKSTDQKLSQIAKSSVNRNALLGVRAEERPAGSGVVETMKRAAASLRFTRKGQSRRRSKPRRNARRQPVRRKRARR
jgi:ferritin-like metal-binding protein YciE